MGDCLHWLDGAVDIVCNAGGVMEGAQAIELKYSRYETNG